MDQGHLPDLDSLRPSLGIPLINTGLQSPLTTPSGIITDDVEGLNAISDENGRVMLQSGIEFSLNVYRGQPEEHLPCFPTLGRLKKTEGQLLALCRNAAFEDALGSHPFVRVAEHSKFLGCPLNVNKQGMAQHYGLATDLLDFTSNFDVASFFATCCWDHGTGEYTPMLRSERPGVIYRIFPAIFVGTDQDAEFEIVGWQPLKRPAQQRAFGLKLKKDQNLGALPTVQMIKFRHCAKTSTRIWQAFDEGRALFPNDAAAELSEQARRLRQFTRQQVNKAWGRLDTWNRQSSLTNYRQTVEKNSGIIISETTILSWDGLDVERDEVKLVNDLNNILNSVRYRMAIYPK